jgi:hypothetical protein
MSDCEGRPAADALVHWDARARHAGPLDGLPGDHELLVDDDRLVRPAGLPESHGRAVERGTSGQIGTNCAR